MTVPGTLDTGIRARWPLASALPPLGALPSLPGTIRAHVDIVLAEWQMGDLADTAKLVASELVTNAVKEFTTPEGEPICRRQRGSVAFTPETQGRRPRGATPAKRAAA